MDVGGADEHVQLDFTTQDDYGQEKMFLETLLVHGLAKDDFHFSPDTWDFLPYTLMFSQNDVEETNMTLTLKVNSKGLGMKDTASKPLNI